MHNEEAAAQQQPIDPRPEGLSEKQDQIIQHVAEFVVNSCDSAQYQHKLRSQTKFNAYFAFLNPTHAYHPYYQYLIQSYQYWKDVEMAAAQAAGGSGGVGAYTGASQQDEGYAYYQQQMQQEQIRAAYYAAGQSNPYAVAASSASYYGDPRSAPSAAAGGDGTTLYGGYYDANGQWGVTQPYPGYTDSGATDPTAFTGDAYDDPTAAVSSATAARPVPSVEATSTTAAAAASSSGAGLSILPAPTGDVAEALRLPNEEGDDEDDDEDEYEMVVENGVQKLVPRRR